MHNYDLESLLGKKASIEVMDDSDGRDAQNMWESLEVISKIYLNSEFKFAFCEDLKVCTVSALYLLFQIFRSWSNLLR
jgi:hypothetical protein